MLHLIINRVKTKDGYVYGVCHYDENDFSKLTCDRFPEKALIELIRKGAKIENACLSPKGELKGTPAALSRLDTKPLLVLSRMCFDNNETIGYRVISSDGQVKKCKNADIIAYCEACEKSGKVPFQNAIYHPKTASTEAHIKSYPDNPFPTEIVKRVVNKYAIKVAEHQPEEKVKPQRMEATPKTKGIPEGNVSEIKELLEKQASLFTPEQIKQIKLGIQNNVNVALYANPEIDWQKMKVVRLAMQNGFNVKYLVEPDYIIPCSLEAIMYMSVILFEGIDVRPFLNPKYTMQQLSELHAGYVSFLDINQFADPNLSVQQMYEIRMRLDAEQWGTLA